MDSNTPSATLERARATIDPRIRARRIAVQRGAGRRRLQILVDVGLVLTVAAGFWLALRTPLLDVDRVEVTGNGHTPTERVLASAGIEPGQQLIDVDLQQAGEAIAALPWVSEVRLHRGLDGRVVVRVSERAPIAVAGLGAGAMLVDPQGRVLGPTSDAPDLAGALMVLANPPGDLAPGSYLPRSQAPALELARAVTASGPGLALTIITGDELVGALPDRGLVRFGDTSRLDAKVRSLRTVLDQVDLACVATIDVSSPGSPVLTREEGCS